MNLSLGSTIALESDIQYSYPIYLLVGLLISSDYDRIHVVHSGYQFRDSDVCLQPYTCNHTRDSGRYVLNANMTEWMATCPIWLFSGADTSSVIMISPTRCTAGRLW